MRYFVLGFLLLCLAVVSVAGFRGSFSRRPPIELFADMVRQPKVRPQAPSGFFPDRFGSRPAVPGTVARGAAYEDTPFNTGHAPGTTNFVEALPVAVTAQLLARGQERYQIHCLPCHGALGDGKGITSKYQLVGAANFHDKRLVEMADGELFNTITYGSKTRIMSAYGANVDPPDRWAIVAYLRALQRSRLATLDDVPEPMRRGLP